MEYEPTIISAESVPEAWGAVVAKLRFQPDGSLFHLVVHVRKPGNELPTRLVEQADYIQGWANELQSEMPHRLPFTHGERIRRWLNVKVDGRFAFLDQIEDYVVPMLVRNPQTKRAVVQISDPSQDGAVTDEPIPALQLIQFTLSDSELHCSAYYRAQEMYFFWLVNVFELLKLQRLVCDRIAERNPQMKPFPGSITTTAFFGYANPADLLGEQSSVGKPTLAIERLDVSQMPTKEFEALLRKAFVEKEKGARAEIVELLTGDLEKLSRVRDVDYQGLQRMNEFLEEHVSAIQPRLLSLMRSLISDVISLDMDLERGKSLQELDASLRKARISWHTFLQEI